MNMHAILFTECESGTWWPYSNLNGIPRDVHVIGRSFDNYGTQSL